MIKLVVLRFVTDSTEYGELVARKGDYCLAHCSLVRVGETRRVHSWDVGCKHPIDPVWLWFNNESTQEAGMANMEYYWRSTNG